MQLERPVERLRSALRTACGVLCVAACLLAVNGCDGDKQAEQPDPEHFLSDQQKALERSKAAAAAMEEAAAARARQTEDARSD